MTRPLLCALVDITLALGLVFAPLSPALAGQTITIDGNSGTGGTVNHNVFGNGDNAEGNAPSNVPTKSPDNNSVNVNSGGSVAGVIVGGFAPIGNAAATASGNSVSISGGSVKDVYGGYVLKNSGAATAAGNSVTISGNAVTGVVYGGDAYSSTATATATGNTVTISGGSVNGNVYGGDAYSSTATATSTGNSVSISSGMLNNGDVYGGYAGASTATATASGNNVSISGGAVGKGVLNLGGVFGGVAFSTSAATASGNSIFISGGSVNGNVKGGFAGRPAGILPIISTATGNTVTISGSPIFVDPDTGLYGGDDRGAGGPGSDLFTGNTLNVWNYLGSSVASVQNFQYYNFILPVPLTGLNVTGTVNFEKNAGDGGASTVIGVNFMGGGSAPQPRESISLIHAGSLTGTITNNGDTLTGKKGALLDVTLRLNQQANDLFAVVEGVQADPRAKALSESFLSGVMLVNQGADHIAGKGMADAVDSAGRARQDGGSGFGGFASVSGGWSRYNTGSHVDMSSLSLIAGLSFGAVLPPGRLTLGAFFEYGTGSYNTYNSFSNAASVDGKGNSYYLGGGILGRMDFLDTGSGNFYTEASFRAGGLNNSYNTSDLRDAMGRSVEGYNSYSPYYGIHAGLGYIWKFTEAASLDVYGKYFWTRQQGVDVRLSTGDPVKFKDADSHRLRLGGRFAYAINDYVASYIGAAWEYEMDGRAKATTYGYNMDTPTMFGSMGVGELGMTLKPAKDLPLSFNLGVQGYAGKREGVTGSLQIRYEF